MHSKFASPALDPAQAGSVLSKNTALTYSVSEAAGVLGVSNQTVYRLLARGLIEPLRGIRHKRIPVVSVKKYIGGNTDV
jgi:hypothetical protein